MSLTVAPETIELFAQAGIGEVVQTITRHQRGRIHFMATYWFARFYHPSYQKEALPGTTVRVIGREGLTLLVETVDYDLPQPQEPISDDLEINQSGLWGLVQRIGSVFANVLN